MNRIATIFLAALTSLTAFAQNNEYHTDLSVGYLNKEWISGFDNGSYHENIFGQEGKRLHGVQLSFHYSDWSSIGLGVHTGLGYEWCMSYSDKIEEMGFERFNEHSLYLPIHAMWRIPLGKTGSISPLFGIGFNWKFHANLKSGAYDGGIWNREKYASDYYYYNRWSDISSVSYGKNGWPHALNVQLEYGINIQIKKAVIGFIYSMGLTDQEFYKWERVKTRQDKISVTLGLNIDD